MQYFQKPESALKRAIEFEKVNQPAMAHEVLGEVLNSKKHRTNWSPIHEQIMIKYIELAVSLQKVPENGLRDFKSIVGSTAISSMTVVVRHYLALCAKKVESAEGEVSEALKLLVEVDDLEESADPEGVLLAMVSDDDTEARTKKAMLMPWVKFLWEAYRTVLEVLRNNAKLENLYQETAQRAFKFCLKFKRRNEFGRLCDQLRRHFGHILKYQSQQNAINLSNPESLQLHLETRFEQLNTAAKMDLWKNAFASIEDINNLMDMSKKAPKPQMLAMYYQKLAMIFWKSEDYAFHSTSWHKLFAISKDHKRTFTSSDEAQQMASCVLLSTLCIPIVNTGKALMNDEPTFTLEKNVRLCALVGISALPSREELIDGCVSMNIMQYVPPQLKEVYALLEQTYHPLQLCKKLTPVLDWLKTQKKLAHYVKPLQNIAVIRLLKQLSQVYSSLSLARLYELVPFLTPFEIEEFLVRAVGDRVISFRLNHRARSLTFGSALLMASEQPDEGPQLQALQSELLRAQLTNLSKRLRTAAGMVHPTRHSELVLDQRAKLYGQVITKVDREHRDNLERKAIIENRKEFIELQALLKHRHAASITHKIMRDQQEAEAARLRIEASERERERERKDAAEINRNNAIEKIEELRKTAIGARAFRDIKPEDLENMDADAIMQRQVDQLEKEKKELATRLRAAEKKQDYFERAKRMEEIPLLKEAVAAQKEAWILKSKEDHATALHAKARLSRMVAHQKAFIDEVLGERQRVYEHKREEFNKAVADQRERKRVEEEERREREEAEREEAEQRAEEEAERLRIEAEERAANLEREREERAEREAKLAEMEEKKRVREAEIEERRAREEEERRAAAPPPSRGSDDRWQRGSGGPPAGGDDRGGPRRSDDRGGGGGDRWQRGDRGPPARGAGGDRDRDGGGGGGDRWQRGSSGDRDRDRDPRASSDRPPERRINLPSRGGDRDRAPPPSGDGGGDRWQRGAAPPPSDRDAGPRGGGGGGGWRSSRGGDDRDGPPRGGDGPPRGSDRGGDGGGWRRGGDDRGPPPARGGDDRGPPPARGGSGGGGGGWRDRQKASGGEGDRKPPPAQGDRKPQGNDDWNTVRR